MSDWDWQLSSGTVEFRQAERDHANGRDRSPRRTVQVACDRCTQGVMDATNDHLLGRCECETIETVTRWTEEPARWSGPYHPTATEVGEMYGAGDYLLIELDSRYSFHSTYPMRVVAEKRYREAREDES